MKRDITILVILVTLVILLVGFPTSNGLWGGLLWQAIAFLG